MHPKSYAGLIEADLEWLRRWTKTQIPVIAEGHESFAAFLFGYSKAAWASFVNRALRDSLDARSECPPGDPDIAEAEAARFF